MLFLFSEFGSESTFLSFRFLECIDLSYDSTEAWFEGKLAGSLDLSSNGREDAWLYMP